MSNVHIFNKLTDPYHGFQGHVIFEVEYLITVQFSDTITKEH